MRRRFLITGGTGFLGSCIAKALLAQGDDVVILYRPSSSLKRLEGILPSLKLWNCEESMLSQLFQQFQIDAIIHVATNYGRNNDTLESIVQSNVQFPLRLLEMGIAHGVPLFINTATTLNPDLNGYALSKHHFAEWGHMLTAQEKIRWVDVSLHQLIGPDDDSSKFTTYLMKSCLHHLPVLHMTEGAQMRDFVYIDDVVSAYQILLEHALKSQNSLLHYEVGMGRSVTMRFFAELVIQVTRSKTEIRYGTIPYRRNEAMYCQADLSALSNLGWQPKVCLEDAVRRTIESMK